MRKSLFLIASFLLVSCSKEQFIANKAPQNSTINPLATTSTLLCSQSTLISPKVDVLLLWDNSSSALFINSSTKASFNQLLTSVSEKFDYHILSAPLISTNANTLNEASLVVKDTASVSGVSGILRTKDQAAASLSFTPTQGNYEPGVDRAYSIIASNRSNGIFRNDAYTIIVVMSNGDDTSCEHDSVISSCPQSVWQPQIQTKINSLLCLRGHADLSINCTGVTPLNSTMMRFINISALTSCNSLYTVNSRYRKVAKSLYETPYAKYQNEISSWPTPTDNLNPFISGGVPYPDSYDICSTALDHIFDGVNTAIKQTLIKHVYEFWPVAGTNDSLDPDTLRVVRSSDGRALVNRTSDSNPTDGFQYIGNQPSPGHYTRLYPTQGEPYVGKMIKLIGTATNNGIPLVTGGDLVSYPECLTVTYDAVKLQYGYVYLKNGEPYVPTIEVRINGNLIPQDSVNGWDYMGLQFTNSLDPNLKIVDLPSGGATSGYYLRLNGTAKFNNTAGSAVSISIYYTSKVN